MRIYFVINDKKGTAFEDLYGKIYSDTNWEKVLNNEIKSYFTSIKEVYFDKKRFSLYLKQCEFSEKIFCSPKSVTSEIDKIADDCKNIKEKINYLFISVADRGLTSNQLSILSNKYSSGSKVFFYNFGKSYVLNKTFFDSGYSIFGNNIAHEAINGFSTDLGEKYFYLCKNGKLSDFIYDENHLSKNLPKNYIDYKQTELINFSKFLEGDNSQYLILQRVTSIEPVSVAFDKKRNIENYSGINYYNVNICDIFKVNSFLKKNKTTEKYEDVTENYPLITFKIKSNGSIKKPKEMKSFSVKTKGFESLTKSSCRQFVMEGTNLYDAINTLIGKDDTWEEDNLSTLETYIKSDDYNNDYEECFLLKVLGKETKETYYSKLLTFVFANSLEILQEYLTLCDDSFSKIKIKAITGIYNEDKNMDVSFTFIDDNDAKYFVVIENKINAPYTEEGEKELADYFKNNNSKTKDYVNKVNKQYKVYKSKNDAKKANQLTKYYLISKVIAKDLSIHEKNIKYYVLAPEYKKQYCINDSKNYYYGEEYDVTSYIKLKEAIDKVIKNDKSDFHSLPSDIKDVIVQFYRSIWPYISDSYTYYKRTMSNRFARTAYNLNSSHACVVEYKNCSEDTNTN